MSKQTDLINVTDAITVSGSNVGIGTSTPASIIHSLHPTSPKLTLERDSTSLADTNVIGEIAMAHKDSNDAGTAVRIIGRAEGTAGAAGLAFNTGTPTSIAEAMRIDSSGNVGLGTDSPRSSDNITSLEISGNTYARYILKATNSGGREYALLSGTSGEFWVYDYTAGEIRFRIDATGAVTKPAQPSFHVRKNADQNNIATGTAATVLWQLESYDVGANFASNTFTAPVAGKYILTASIRVDSSDSGSSHDDMAIVTSNRNYKSINDLGRLSGDPIYWTHTINAVADMDAGDTAFVTFFQTDGNPQADIKNDAGRTYFSGILVG